MKIQINMLLKNVQKVEIHKNYLKDYIRSMLKSKNNYLKSKKN